MAGAAGAEDKMKIKNPIIAGIIIILIVGAGFFLVRANKDVNGDSINNGRLQKVALSMRNGNYYFNTIKVKEGLPVELTLDSTVNGCFRVFTIRDFGVSKYSKSPEDTITFTPQQKGTFRFACGMGMGYGQIVVE